MIESGHHVALNPRGPEAAAEAALYEAVYAYPNRPAVRFDVSAGSMPDTDRRQLG
jgi:hypothetical protein